MTETIDTTQARVVQPDYDNKGNPVWRTRMSTPDDSFALLPMVADRIIPVIFVPGVMGSNLIEKDKNNDRNREDAVKWRMDSTGTALVWASPARNAAFRKRYLNPLAMEVDDQGEVPTAQSATAVSEFGAQQLVVTPSPVAASADELRRRGWGEVANLSYGEWLIWLENALNDVANIKQGERVNLMRESLRAAKGETLLADDEVGLSYRYRFPVHACGYNWLDDNKTSADRLSKRIDEVIKHYKAQKKRVDKVILVTHSMGGLVARYCSEVLNRKADIYGITPWTMP